MTKPSNRWKARRARREAAKEERRSKGLTTRKGYAPGVYPEHLKKKHEAMRALPKLMRPETRALAQRFLDAYAETPMNKAAAARATGVSRHTINYWLREYEWFRLAFEDLEESIKEQAKGELYRRAVHGVEEPQFGRVGKDQDGIVGYVQKYSDRLLERLVAADDPRFRHNHNGEQGAGVQMGVIIVNGTVDNEQDFEAICRDAKQIQEDNRARIIDGRKTDT